MLWNKYIPQEFCHYIYLKDNYLILIQHLITFQKANTIVRNFVKQNIKCLDLLKSYFMENVKIYQHPYATFQDVTTSLVQRIDQSLTYAIENELTTENTLKQVLAIIKKHGEVAKNLENYKERPASTINEFEQVPITENYQFVP